MAFESPAKAHKAAMDDLMKRRFFFAPAFEVYGGEKGLYDLGPTGTGIKNNMLSIWRKHFVVSENMHEVECTSLTPLAVLRTSGHLERFKDVMVRDLTTGECFRADHLLTDTLKKRLEDGNLSEEERQACELAIVEAEVYDKVKLKEVFARLKIQSPNEGNALSDPEDFNMMFETTLGPRAAAGADGTPTNAAFLRPETAQGIFLSFPRLYEYNAGKLPFAAAQVGVAFRNEIAPRAQLLRVREFTMAEIEHFLDPEDKSCSKFAGVRDLVLPLFAAPAQVPGGEPTRMPIGDAVAQGIVNNETLGYFMVRIWQYLVTIGINADGIRFRQHRHDEMAHYACDCWDAEILTSYGWVECVGCADRSAYDLSRHGEATGRNLSAQKLLPEPIIETVLAVTAQKKIMGPKFKAAPKGVMKLMVEKLEGMNSKEAAALQATLASGSAQVEVDGASYEITPEMVEIKEEQRKTSVRTFYPSVIEPSFGIGRIMYALFEHSFGMREGTETKGWMKLSPLVAPVKCCVAPLLTNNPAAYNPIMQEISDALVAANMPTRVDDSGASLGKKYVRFDEVGVPYAVTVDVESIQQAAAGERVTVTLRDRDTMQQVRLGKDEVPAVVADLCTLRRTWADVVTQYGLVESDASSAKAKK